MRRNRSAGSPNDRFTPGRTACLVLCLGAGVLALLTGCSSTETTTLPSTTAPADFSGYVQEPPRQVGSVSITDVQGKPVSPVADPGGFRIVYFGYTTCPDVCPTTMSFVKSALRNLPAADRDRIQVDMITIDPTRDTATEFEEYLTAFIPDGRALRTEDQALLRSTADAFGANYEVTTNAEGEIEVSHSGDLFVVDDEGAIVLAWPFGVTPTAIENDLRRLLDGDRPTPA